MSPLTFYVSVLLSIVSLNQVSTHLIDEKIYFRLRYFTARILYIVKSDVSTSPHIFRRLVTLAQVI